MSIFHLQTVIDLDTMVPTDELTSEAIDWVRSVGSSATTVSQIVNSTDPDVMRGIQAGLDRVNEAAVSRAQRVQKWSLLPVDFSQPGGELGKFYCILLLRYNLAKNLNKICHV